MIHLFIGPPGSGKTTILTRVAEANNVFVLNGIEAEKSHSIWYPAFEALRWSAKPTLVIDEASFVTKIFTDIILMCYFALRDSMSTDPEVWIASQKDIFPDHDTEDGVIKYRLNPLTTQP